MTAWIASCPALPVIWYQYWYDPYHAYPRMTHSLTGSSLSLSLAYPKQLHGCTLLEQLNKIVLSGDHTAHHAMTCDSSLRDEPYDRPIKQSHSIAREVCIRVPALDM